MDSVVNSRHPKFEISGRKIGLSYPPLVIAEIGINHGGSLENAFELVKSAHSAGVEVIKHQTHVVEDEMSTMAQKTIPGNSDVSIYEVISRCSLSEKEERSLKEYVESLGMIFFSTPFSREAANRLNKMDLSAYKVGSGECNNYPLLQHIAAFGKPVILSTGMNDIDSVKKAVSIFQNAGIPIALLHTTNIYPTPPHLVRFGAMIELANAFPNLVYGLSDHTQTNSACLGAIALGASIVERHYTDTMDRTGPDIICSMDESTCRQLIHDSKHMAQMRGGTKQPVPEEEITMAFAFSTVCTIAPIKTGEAFTLKNIWVKRPGTGAILAKHFDRILGQKAATNLTSGVHLNLDDIQSPLPNRE
jgi:N-acetylneuraminate synthase